MEKSICEQCGNYIKRTALHKPNYNGETYDYGYCVYDHDSGFCKTIIECSFFKNDTKSQPDAALLIKSKKTDTGDDCQKADTDDDTDRASGVRFEFGYPRIL